MPRWVFAEVLCGKRETSALFGSGPEALPLRLCGASKATARRLARSSLRERKYPVAQRSICAWRASMAGTNPNRLVYLVTAADWFTFASLNVRIHGAATVGGWHCESQVGKRMQQDIEEAAVRQRRCTGPPIGC